jgi:hypothetical protein
MPELELALRGLGREVEFPATPDLAPAVGRRLAERWTWWRRPLVIATAVLVVAVAAVLAVPPARSALFDWLGIGGARIVRVDELPPAPTSGHLDLGRTVTLAEARRLSPWLLVPSVEGFGDSDRVSYSPSVPGGKVTFLWGTPEHLRLLLTEFRGTPYIEKLVRSEAKIESVSVDGHRGVWLEEPHVLFYIDPFGRTRENTSRVAGKTLLWERNGVTLRLEGELSKADAVRLASKLQP